jgi:hypothetical protein
MNHDSSPISRKNNVGLAGEFPDVNAEPKSMAVQQAADETLWSGVDAAYAAHHPASRSGIHDVHHF